MRMHDIVEEPTDTDVERLRERARALGYELLTDGRYRAFHLRNVTTGVWPDCTAAADPEHPVDGKDVDHFFHEIDAWLAAKEPARARDDA